GYLAATRRRAQARGIAALLGCGAAAGTAVMIRPGNLLCVAVLLALVAVSHLSPRRSVATVLLGTAFLLPMIPQSLANFRATRRLDPLTMRGMYATQVRYGLELAKYGTIVRVGEPPELRYVNPFAPAGAPSLAAALTRRPISVAESFAVHTFAMLDQDFLF